jgi:hypothetical protein
VVVHCLEPVAALPGKALGEELELTTRTAPAVVAVAASLVLVAMVLRVAAVVEVLGLQAK